MQISNNMSPETKEKPRVWYALYTRPKYELRVHADVQDKGLISFLPMQSVVRRWSDRKKRMRVPLFPGYVFVHTTPSERFKSLQTRGVVRMVSFNGVPARIPAAQIEAVRRITENNYSCEPYPRLARGDRVNVMTGPLAGLTGRIVEHRGRQRFIVSLDAIRQHIAVAMDIRHLASAERTCQLTSEKKECIAVA